MVVHGLENRYLLQGIGVDLYRLVPRPPVWVYDSNLMVAGCHIFLRPALDGLSLPYR